MHFMILKVETSSIKQFLIKYSKERKIYESSTTNIKHHLVRSNRINAT